MVGDISFQKIYVLFGLKHHTVETSGDVTNGATPYSIGAALVSNGAGSGSTGAVPGLLSGSRARVYSSSLKKKKDFFKNYSIFVAKGVIFVL